MSINGYYSPSAAPPDSKCSYIANQSSVISRNSGTQGHRENGRVYGEFRPGRYLFPIDEEEKDRFDVFHRVVSLARQNKHFDNEVPDRARVLDLGTGTGIWAIDVSDALWKGPENHGLVHGLDLAYIQPADVPSTVSFMQADVEEPWPLRENDYDLIHIQLLMGGIRDWTDLYRKIFRHLKPGGYLEHVEIDWTFRSDDNTLTSDTALVAWSEAVHRALRTFGTPLDINDRIKGDLQAIGFTDVTETIVKLPINPWADNKHDQELGRWFNLAATHAVNAMSLAPLTRVEGWPVEQVQSLGSEVKKNLCKLSIHAYCRLHVWTARKPSQ